MRPTDLEAAFARAGGPVKAVFPVHLAGQCENLPVVHDIASHKSAIVIEDACHALGTNYLRDSLTTKVGSCVDATMSAFSFHPVKAIAMGEGGAVTTRDPTLAKRLLRLRNHGMTRDVGQFEQKDLAFDSDGIPNPWYYEMSEIGYNYRASDIHAALGLSQLRKIDRFVSARRNIARHYDRCLKHLAPLITPLARAPNCEPAWHLYVALFDFDGLRVSRNKLMALLKEEGIGTQVHYIPVSAQPYYRRRYNNIPLPGADRYYSRCLTLPLHADMTESDVDRVVSALTGIVGKST
jgi:dTDP-4-amino-4,6-dideoxygalactose transaminase